MRERERKREREREREREDTEVQKPNTWKEPLQWARVSSFQHNIYTVTQSQGTHHLYI